MKPSQADIIPLKPPDLSINGNKVKRVHSTKFLGVILDEHCNWKEHIQLVQSKISKNLGIMYKSKRLLNQHCLKTLYFSFIHSYINYCNIAWASTYKTHLERIYIIQKKAARIIMNQDMYTKARPLMKSLQILNVYQLNIFQTVLFMFKLKNEMNPQVFKNKLSAINHRYPTRFSQNNFTIPKATLRRTDFTITCRGPRLWNCIPTTGIKSLRLIITFQNQLKRLLLNLNNETEFF